MRSWLDHPAWVLLTPPAVPPVPVDSSAFGASFFNGCVSGHGYGSSGLGVLFGEVVPGDGDGCGPSECSVGSVVIVEVDEPVVGLGAFGF